MYYELEIYDNTITDADLKEALNDNPKRWGGPISNARHALKAIFGGSGKYSIAMGKEIITSLQVVNADLATTPNPLLPVTTLRQLFQPGLRLEVTGHLYEPFRTYDNAALLFLWFQEMENYNIATAQQKDHRDQVISDMKKIDPKHKGVAVVRENPTVQDLISANIGLRHVVLRVLNDDGFVFRIYNLPRAYLANYAESYDMAKDTGEFSMVIIQDTTTGETGEIKGKDLDDGFSAFLNKASRGAAKAKAYVDGTAAAVKTAAAVTNSVLGFRKMNSKGKETDTDKILKKVASGLDVGANGVTHVGDSLGAVGGIGRDGATQEHMDQLTKATDSIAQDERDIATEVSHPEILKEEERKKMNDEAKDAAELEFRVDQQEQKQQEENSKTEDEQLEYQANKQIKEEKMSDKKKEQETARVEQELHKEKIKKKIKEELEAKKK